MLEYSSLAKRKQQSFFRTSNGRVSINEHNEVSGQTATGNLSRKTRGEAVQSLM